MVELILLIAGLAVSVITGTAQQITSHVSSNIRGQLLSIAKAVSTQISKNNALKEKLINAYNDKNGKLLSSLMYGMGFGARIESIKKELDNDKANFNSQMDEINASNTQLEAINADATNRAANAGTIAGNKQANAEGIALQADEAINLAQNIQGGTE